MIMPRLIRGCEHHVGSPIPRGRMATATYEKNVDMKFVRKARGLT